MGGMINDPFGGGGRL